MTELPKTKITNHETEVISELIKHINAAKHRLRIFTGEANCNVYNNPGIETALKNAYERGVRIQIIAGPILSVCPGSNYRSAVLEKAQRKELELFYRSRRSTEQHFCIADEAMGVRQHYHRPMTGYRPPEPIPLDELSSYIKKFDTWVTTGVGTYNDHSFIVQFSQNPESQFLLLDREKIRYADNTAESLGLRFNDLSREEIETLASMTETPTTTDIAGSTVPEPSAESDSSERRTSMSRWQIVFLSIVKTLRLMGLVLWYSLRYPLTESVIDYEKGEVYNKPHAHT